MDESLYEEDIEIPPACPEEQQMAEVIWETLEKIVRHGAMSGDPKSGDMDVMLDGHFNLLLLVRAVLRARLRGGES